MNSQDSLPVSGSPDERDTVLDLMNNSEIPIIETEARTTNDMVASVYQTEAKPDMNTLASGEDVFCNLEPEEYWNAMLSAEAIGEIPVENDGQSDVDYMERAINQELERIDEYIATAKIQQCQQSQKYNYDVVLDSIMKDSVGETMDWFRASPKRRKTNLDFQLAVIDVQRLQSMNTHNSNPELQLMQNVLDQYISKFQGSEQHKLFGSDMTAKYDPLIIGNVIACLDVGCQLNLEHIGRYGVNVIYIPETHRVTMSTKRPYRTAHVWASGKVKCLGMKTTDDASYFARRIVRSLTILGYQASLRSFKVANIFSHTSLKFPVDLVKLFELVRREKIASIQFYEPEWSRGVKMRFEQYKVTIKVFGTGSMTVIGQSEEELKNACHIIFPYFVQCMRPFDSR